MHRRCPSIQRSTVSYCRHCMIVYFGPTLHIQCRTYIHLFVRTEIEQTDVLSVHVSN